MKFYDTYSANECTSASELDAIGALRYEAYRSVDAIEPNPEHRFLDRYDGRPNTRNVLVTRETQPVAAIRASVYAKELGFAPIPCMEVYKDDLLKRTGSEEASMVESNRFVVHPEVTDSTRLFKVQFRFIILNLLKYKADWVVTAVRPRHAKFYSRICMYPISEPRRYPGLNVDMVLLAGDCRVDLPSVIRQDPIYTVSQEELDAYAVCAPTLASS